MTRPSGLGLSAIIASNDASPNSLLGLSAVSRRRLWLLVPALFALAYPSLLSLLSSGLVLVHGSASPNGVIVWVSVIASLTLAVAVMLVSFVFGLALGSPHVRDDPGGCRARSIAHLAFATPSFYVGFGNVAYYGFQAPSVAPVAWLVFWALVMMIALRGPRETLNKAVAFPAEAGPQKLGAAVRIVTASVSLLVAPEGLAYRHGGAAA